MKLLWRLSKEAIQYKSLYVIALLSTFLLTLVELIVPKVISGLIGIVEEGVSQDDLRAIAYLTIAITILSLLRVLFRFLRIYLSHKAAWNLVGSMRSKIYDKLQQFPLSFFGDKQTGDLMSRIINDTSNFELLYAHVILDLLTNCVTVIGVFSILMSTNWKLALLTCCPIPLVLLGGWVFSTKIRPFFRRNNAIVGELSSILQDNISGIHEIQAFVKEDEESEKIHAKNDEIVHAMLKALKLSGFFHPLVEFFGSIGTIIVVGVGGYLAFKGEVNVSDIVAFTLYLTMFYAPIAGLAKMLEDLQQASAGAERAMMIVDTPVAIKNSPNAYDITDVRGQLTFDNVSFSYDGETDVLKGISFTCKPGEVIAVVGPTGVGKTTLTQLISRGYDPTSGGILIDGHNTADVTLKSLRRNISPVLQDTFLFNTTIANNISYAKGDATIDEIIEAAKAAYIHDDIMDMPQGYDTVVGERGVRLSGGQKQRISIARAILKNARIIIMDEATASVDSETEHEIQKAIYSLAGSHTILVIAHRLSTIRNADKILVLDDGRIAEEGTHSQLMEKDGIYRRMQQYQGVTV